LNFTFSVTGIDNGGGSIIGGTFTGEVFGLTVNSTSSASSVVIQSIPAGMNNLVSPPINATLWGTQEYNSFTVSGGQIVGGGFWAEQTINGNSQGYQLYLNAPPSVGNNFLNLDGTDSTYVWGADGLAAANFVPAVSSVPEPASLGLAITGALCVGGATWHRNRKDRVRRAARA
jgi:hypothetical protein